MSVWPFRKTAQAEPSALASDAAKPDFTAAAKLAGRGKLQEAMNAKAREIETWLTDKADFDRRLAESRTAPELSGGSPSRTDANGA